MSNKETEALEFLIEKAKAVMMTADQVAEQRRSFAYGNSAFENPMITKEMIKDEAEKLGL